MTAPSPPQPVDAVLAQAIHAHQSGARARAEQLYREVLRRDPRHAQALYLLGAVCFEQGASDQAQALLEQAAAQRPQDGAIRSLLGVVYATRGESARALPHLRAAVAAAPGAADAHYNLGRALLDLARYDEAAAAYEQALKLRPDYPQALNGLAACRKGQGRLDAAIALLRECAARFPGFTNAQLALGRTYLEAGDEAAAVAVLEACAQRHPGAIDAFVLLGNLRYRQARFDEAEALLRRAVALDPAHVAANNQLGAVLQNLGRLAEAEERVRVAYRSAPHDPEVLTNLGLVFHNKGNAREAADCHRRALAINDRLPEPWNNLGIALQNMGDWAEAIACYDRAIALKPEFHGARTNRANALLTLGRLGEGWLEYRFRFDQKIMASKRREFPFPVWRGEAGPDVRLLVWTDQGLGDEVLYASMLPDARARVGDCVLECTARLAPLFARSFPGVRVVARRKPYDPVIDRLAPTHQISLSELGEFLRPSIASIPPHAGYLKADADLRDRLRQRYRALAQGRRIVGISWKSANPANGAFKTLPLTRWLPILRTPGILFVCLQYGEVAADVADARAAGGIDIHVDPEIDAVTSPDAAAAQTDAMDLVVTTSNTTAHFAGALGRPTWTLIPMGQGAFWYWFLDREDSPWYPAMRLIRQTQPGVWDEVVAETARRLAEWRSSWPT
jgi:tetratricopeptide (TPR) repeat protein